MSFAPLQRSKRSKPVPVSKLGQPLRSARPPARSHPIVQARLRIGAQNDRFEQEADRLADAVMRMEARDITHTAPPITQGFGIGAQKAFSAQPIQRLCNECEERTLHRKAASQIPVHSRPHLSPGALTLRRALPVNVPHPDNQPSAYIEDEERTDLGPVRLAVKVGRSDDPMEIEADQVAERIMRIPQRSGAAADTAPLQALALSSAGGGRPLAPATRSFFESRLGFDLGPVVQAKLRTGALDSTSANHTPLKEEAQRLRTDLRRSAGLPLDARIQSTMQERNWSALDLTSRAGGVAPDHRALEVIAETDGLRSPRSLKPSSTNRVPNAAGPVPSPDFSSVRLHADTHARAATRRLGARAFTIGEHIYADPVQLAAPSPSGGGLLTHELSHVVQQRALGRQFMQPRLIASGSDADILRFITLAEAAMGEDLERDAVTGEITAVGSLAAGPTSPAFATAMHRIIDDPVQDAEAHFGVGQPRVGVGAFPQPSDMTGSTEQLIDIDDVEAIETGAPGSGLGKLAHELTENYTAHAAVPVAGVDQFSAAHEAGLSAESDVAEDTVGPGRRVANVDTPAVGNTFTRVQDFENYYLVFDLTRNPVNNDFSVSNAHQAPRVNVSTRVVDHFVTGSAAIPAAGAAAIAAAAADVAANSSATVRIEGFTDAVGTAVGNVILSNQRAAAAEAALRAAGVAGGRIHAVGGGQTSPVAPNNTEANRARNRRVVITVDRPGP